MMSLISRQVAVGLEDIGFKVDAFNNPLEALSSFKPGAYDLALIDYTWQT
jgi:DNA-binding response OmpR family regulator